MGNFILPSYLIDIAHHYTKYNKLLPIIILSAEGLPSGFIFSIFSMMGMTFGMGSALL